MKYKTYVPVQLSFSVEVDNIFDVTEVGKEKTKMIKSILNNIECDIKYLNFQIVKGEIVLYNIGD